MKEKDRVKDTLNRLCEHYTITELAQKIERSRYLIWSWSVGKYKPGLRDWKKLRYLDRQIKLRGE